MKRLSEHRTRGRDAPTRRLLRAESARTLRPRRRWKRGYRSSLRGCGHALPHVDTTLRTAVRHRVSSPSIHPASRFRDNSQLLCRRRRPVARANPTEPDCPHRYSQTRSAPRHESVVIRAGRSLHAAPLRPTRTCTRSRRRREALAVRSSPYTRRVPRSPLPCRGCCLRRRARLPGSRAAGLPRYEPERRQRPD